MARVSAWMRVRWGEAEGQDLRRFCAGVLIHLDNIGFSIIVENIEVDSEPEQHGRRTSLRDGKDQDLICKNRQLEIRQKWISTSTFSNAISSRELTR